MKKEKRHRRVLHILRKGPVVKMLLLFISTRKEMREDFHHIWLFREPPITTDVADIAKRTGGDVIEIFKEKSVLKRAMVLKREFGSADVIIYHALNFSPIDLFLLSSSKKLVRKVRWVVWGYDLYEHFTERGTYAKIGERLKARIASQVPIMASVIEVEKEHAKEWYGFSGSWQRMFYPFELDFETLENIRGCQVGERTETMLLGNSASPSNRHLEALEFLHEQRSIQVFKVICPLSYGDMQHSKNVARRGKELLSDDFVPIHELMKFEDYAKLLANVDAAWMNHKRQQALGNIVALLYLGKKVFLDGSTTSFAYFKDLGVSIFDSRELDGKKRIDLKLDEGAASRNAEIIKKEFSRDGASKLWVDLFRS